MFHLTATFKAAIIIVIVAVASVGGVYVYESTSKVVVKFPIQIL